MKRITLVLLVMVLSAAALYTFRYSFPGFAKWNAERISDNTAWSYYLESYSNGQYVFRHEHKIFTVSCAWDGGSDYSKEAAEMSCDELKTMVGMQLVGEMGPGEIFIKSVHGASIKILAVRQVGE
jgi:hypothetical protein